MGLYGAVKKWWCCVHLFQRNIIVWQTNRRLSYITRFSVGTLAKTGGREFGRHAYMPCMRTGITIYLPGSRAILANSSRNSSNDGRLSASSIQPALTVIVTVIALWTFARTAFTIEVQSLGFGVYGLKFRVHGKGYGQFSCLMAFWIQHFVQNSIHVHEKKTLRKFRVARFVSYTWAYFIQFCTCCVTHNERFSSNVQL